MEAFNLVSLLMISHFYLLELIIFQELLLYSVVFCRVNITYIDKNGNKIPVRGKVGDNVLYLAHRYGIEMEGV
jgi:hypothetical protein